MISKHRLLALRLMQDDWLMLVQDAVAGDREAGDQVAVLGGALIGFIPELLDEIERLQAKRPDQRGHVLKMDRSGGVA